MKFKIKIFIFFLTIILIFPAISFAKNEDTTPPINRTLVVSPLTFEIILDPGESSISELSVLNAGGEPLFVNMETEDFTTIGETGKVVVEELKDETYSLKKWITVSPTNFTLAPGEKRYVNFQINVPVDGEPGGYYGAVLSSATGADESMGVTEGSGLSIAQKVGGLVLLSVAGEVVEEMSVREFSTPSFSEYGPVPFTMRFENLGNVHIKPKGFISITNFFDEKIIDIPFPQHNILPGATRTIEAQWDTKWLLGKYTATLAGIYGGYNTPFEQTITFWVFPWKIMIPSGLGLFILLLIFYGLRKRLSLAWRILWKGEKAFRK